MLQISDSELKLTSQGYHFDENGRKFIQIWTSLNFVEVRIKIQPHKEMHIKSVSVYFPYIITNNWVIISFSYIDIKDILTSYMSIEEYINDRCKEVWFV